MSKAEKGLVHLYVGDGKGKTTAAVGLACRAIGRDKKVLFCQFLKGIPTGEVLSLEKLGASVIRVHVGSKFVWVLSEEEKAEERETYQVKFSEIVNLHSDYDIVILDEVIDAVNCGFIDNEQLLSFVKNKEDRAELVMTGRNPHEDIVNVTDYYTKLKCIKHPYSKGVSGRKGIEF